jgi:hypothetical protein
LVKTRLNAQQAVFIVYAGMGNRRFNWHAMIDMVEYDL